MKGLKIVTYLDDQETFTEGDGLLLIAQKTDEFMEFMDNSARLKEIDERCPSTYYVTIPIPVLLASFLAQHPDALSELLAQKEEDEPEISDDEIMQQYLGYPPEEWDVPGSIDYTLTHQHGGEYVESDDEPDEDAIIREYDPDEGPDYYCYEPEDFE